MAEPTADDPFAKPEMVAPDPNDPFAKPAPKGPGVLESIGRGAAEGATFGFDDKLGFDKEKRELSRKTNPWAHFFGELLGGVAPVALTGGIGTLARGTGLGARAVRAAVAPFNVGEIGTLGQAIGQGTKLGGVYGGLSGAGHADVQDTDTLGESLLKRGEGALAGAVTGAPFGAVTGGAGHYLYRGAQGLGTMANRAIDETAPGGRGALVKATQKLEEDRIAPQDIIDNILGEFPSASDVAKGGMSRRYWGDTSDRQAWSREMVLDLVTAAAEGQTPAQIKATLAAKHAANFGGKSPGDTAISTLLGELEDRHLGPLMLLDRALMQRPGAGQNTQWTMRAAAATPGEARSIAMEDLLGRQTEAGGRLQQLIARAVGSPDLEGELARQNTRFQNAASNLYAPAFAEERPFNLNPLFTTWQERFDKMRGLIPDTVRSRLNQMMWTDAASGARTAPDSLQGFMFAREGLRDLIDELPKGNNLRRYLSQLYEQATDVVAAENPKWKVANDFYQEGLLRKPAMLGQQLATRQGAGSREALDALAAADKASAAAKKQFNAAQKTYDAIAGTPTAEQQAAYDLAKARFDALDAKSRIMRTAYAQNLTDQIANSGETTNLVRRLLLPGSKNIIAKVMGEDAPAFIKGLEAEAAMHKTYSAQFGAQTTPLREAVDELNWAPRFEASMMNPLTWFNPLLQQAQEYMARVINNRRNAELMKLYTSTDPLKQLQALREMQALHQTRSAWGNAVGKTAIGSSGPTIDALLGDQYGATYQPPRRRTPAKP